MIKDGLLDKYGKPTDATPKEWTKVYTDYRFVTSTVVQYMLLFTTDDTTTTVLQPRGLCPGLSR